MSLFTALLLGLAAQSEAPVAPSAQEPDVSIQARVTAREIRWRQAGDLEIDAHVQPGGVVVEESLTTGLPSPITVGRTFRDVEWRLDLSGSLQAGPAPAAADTPTTP